MLTVFERDFDQELVDEENQATLERLRIFTQSDLDAAVKTASDSAYASGFDLGQSTGIAETKVGLERHR